MLPVFDTPSGLPTSQINLAQQRGAPNTEFPDLISTAEAGTLQLEFRQLSEITGDDIYWKRAEKVRTRVVCNQSIPRQLGRRSCQSLRLRDCPTASHRSS